MNSAQAVVIGEKVYLGGGNTENVEYDHQVFQYDPSRDEWNRLPPHKAIFFSIAQFKGSLITVGGVKDSVITGKVYRFIEESQNWKKVHKPMPTARYWSSVATTQSAIVASGGVTDVRDVTGKDRKPVPCATVEVYSRETSQWHTADPLPVPCLLMTSVTISDTWYQVGGYDADNATPTVLYAPLTALIQKATSFTHQSASPMSVWKTLPDTPLIFSAAASLNGNLLAVGGYDDETWDDNTSVFPSLHIFLSLANAWVRVTNGNLPEPCCFCTAVQLSSNQLLVVGGRDDQKKRTKTVFLGSITI